MAICLHCRATIRFGNLCVAHAEQIATAADLTAEQVVSRPVDGAAACLVDQWGNRHPLPPRATIGRLADECAVAILHHSVSGVHAALEQAGEEWQLVDRGSLNGSFRDDAEVQRTRVVDGDRLRFGNVSFFFVVGQPAAAGARPATGQTVDVRSSQVAFQARVRLGDGEVGLVQRATGGIVRAAEAAVAFARLEFGLLRVLAERRRAAGDPELAFVSSQELAELLDFRSRDADGENVRELVRRVRKKLATERIGELIESRQGAGYRLAGAVDP